MRITNSILARNALRSIRQGLSGLDEAQQRLSSGLRLQRASDDPAAAADVLGTDRRLRALDQYQRNIGAASSRLAAQEDAIQQTGDLLSRARELAIGQGDANATAETRRIAAAEVTRLLEATVHLANARFGSGYLFGGAFADRAPLDAAGNPADAARLPAGNGATEVAAAQTIATTLDAQSTFIDSNAMSALRSLKLALETDDTSGITQAAGMLTGAIDGVQTRIGEVGARVQQLELARSNAEALDTSLRSYRSELAEVDFEEAVTTLVTRQSALEAALSATSRLLTTTLTDYLR